MSKRAQRQLQLRPIWPELIQTFQAFAQFSQFSTSRCTHQAFFPGPLLFNRKITSLTYKQPSFYKSMKKQNVGITTSFYKSTKKQSSRINTYQRTR